MTSGKLVAIPAEAALIHVTRSVIHLIGTFSHNVQTGELLFTQSPLKNDELVRNVFKTLTGLGVTDVF